MAALLIVFGPVTIVLIILILTHNKLKAERQVTEQLRNRIAKLEPYESIVDAEKEANRILKEAERKGSETIKKAVAESQALTESTQNKLSFTEAKLRTLSKQADELIADARKQADMIVVEAEKTHDTVINEANQKAEQIAGDALKAMRNAELYKQTAEAMKHAVEGYGNDYVLPSSLLLDDLAEEFGYEEAGAEFKRCGDRIKMLVKIGKGAVCDYADSNRRMTAINFVLDAFNGKRDAIMSRVKKDNYGTLKQKLIDAFTLVNYNGRAFRNAQITDEYFSLVLDQLKAGCTLQALKERQQVEQREIRERMREEEKARREIERALRDAAKEKEMLDKAKAILEEKFAAASAEQKAQYEAQLAEMQEKIKEAEERNQRAMSMAQQTKAGHVYIISNVGSFGENVYKIGMTRRLEPMDRIQELGSASVPFGFDVHALIWSEDAPSLEAELHRRFALVQMNKINHRKEFFQTTLAEIREEVERSGIKALWTMTAAAQEYRETLAINKILAESKDAQEAWLKKEYDEITIDVLHDEEQEDLVNA